MLQIIGELIYCLVKKKKKKNTLEKKSHIQIVLLSSPEGIFPPAGGLFHYDWALEAKRTIYIFIFKASVGLSHLNFSLSFLSSHSFKQMPQEVTVQLNGNTFQPFACFQISVFS